LILLHHLPTKVFDIATEMAVNRGGGEQITQLDSLPYVRWQQVVALTKV
jgi:hypothetical protein